MNDKILHVTGRQVPSSLHVCSLGPRISRKDVSCLKEMGFPLLQRDVNGAWSEATVGSPVESSISSQQVDYLSSLLQQQQEENTRFEMGLSSLGSESSGSVDMDTDTEEEPGELTEFYRFLYNDPFKVNSVMYFKGSRNPKDVPMLLCWPGGVVRLQDNIPVRALGEDWDGNRRRGIPFFKIGSTDVKMNVLLKHTHWGKLLSERAYRTGVDKIETWPYTELIKTLRAFLDGKHDPSWKRGKIAKVYGEAYKPRDRTSRALRFLQVLRTVDGMFAQIYLADITAGWNWQLFDNFVLRNLSLLIQDEFYDGELDFEEALDVETHYEALKRFRGKCKEAVLRSERLPLPDTAISMAFRSAVIALNTAPEGHSKLQRLGVIVQSRGSGTPPPLVVLKSKAKFLSTISEKPVVSKEKTVLTSLLLKSVISGMPDSAFTGLSTKASINVTGSACFEESRKTGGTLEEIRKYVCDGELGRKVKIFDLNDPTVGIQYKELSEITHGEYIFWRCLEEVLATPPEKLREASLVVIREPAKARMVTKARAALKVILDVVNGICSHPLKKGLDSSTSGMGKSHHGWNFFKEFYNSWKDLAFEPDKIQRFGVSGGPERVETVTYKDVFVSFTDYEEATDRMAHETYAKPAAELWMRKCGIPNVLRGIVHETCFKPRTIYFSATGVLKRFGEHCGPRPEDRCITLRQGVLMGDPLTKVLLHLLNASARESSRVGGLGTSLLPATSVLLSQTQELRYFLSGM